MMSKAFVTLVTGTALMAIAQPALAAELKSPVAELPAQTESDDFTYQVEDYDYGVSGPSAFSSSVRAQNGSPAPQPARYQAQPAASDKRADTKAERELSSAEPAPQPGFDSVRIAAVSESELPSR